MIYWECVSPGVYNFYFFFYSDCSGISPSSSYTLRLESLSGGCPTQTVTLNQISIVDSSTSQLCVNSSCNGGAILGYDWAFFGATNVSVDPSCVWHLEVTETSRGGSLTNISNPGSANMYIWATLNPLQNDCNGPRPYFQNPLYACTGEYRCFIPSLYDPDGDSLSFQLTCVLDDSATSVTYAPGYSCTDPVDDVTGISFDPKTGALCFEPASVQVDAIAMVVYQWRDGVIIDSSYYEYPIVVQNCPGSNAVPEFTSPCPISNVTGAVQSACNILTVCQNTPMSFQISANDPNGGDLLTLEMSNTLPGATVSYSCQNCRPISATVTWTPTQAGYYYAVFNVRDNACDIPGMNQYAVIIHVTEGTFATPDTGYYCPGELPVQLNVTGGSSFTWSPATGLSCTNCQNPQASPSTSTQYIVTSDLVGCKNKDTVEIIVTTKPSYTISAFPDTICKNGTSQLSISVDPIAGPFTYNWSPCATLSSCNSSNPVASPSSTTTYYVDVLPDNGCPFRDSVKVVVRPGSSPFLSVSRTPGGTVCPGSNVQLNAIASMEPPCNLTSSSCGSLNTTWIGTGTVTNASTTPFRDCWHDARVQYLILASELNAAGMSGITLIRAIAFEVTSIESNGPYTYNGFTIKIGCTDLNSMSSSFVSGLTTVYSVGSYTPSNGINNFVFTQPYVWDGTSNLIIEVCWDNNAYDCTSASLVSSTTTAFTSVVYDYADNSTGCTLNSPITSSDRPNIRFRWCNSPPGAFTYSWTPVSLVSDPTIPDPVGTVGNGNTTFGVLVCDAANPQCCSYGSVTVPVDSTIYVQAGPDTALCTGETVQLNTTVVGSATPICPSSCNTVAPSPCGTTISQIVVGSGNSSNLTSNPFNDCWHDFRFQYLFTAADLTNAGLKCGTIRNIAFNVSSFETNGPYTYNNFTIKMGCTSLSSFSGMTSFVPGLATVYGPVTYTPTTGWNIFNINPDFEWDGSSNIIIEVCWDNNAYDCSAEGDSPSSTTSYVSVLYDYQDNASGCTLNSPITSSLRPNVRFNLCEAPPGVLNYSWSPPGLVSDPTIPDPTYTQNSTSTEYLVVTVTGGVCPAFDTVTIGYNCPLPTDQLLLTLSYQNDQHVLLTWRFLEPSVHFKEYILESSIDGQSWSHIASVDGVSNRYVLESPIEKTYYRIIGFAVDGNVYQSNVVYALPDRNSSITDQIKVMGWQRMDEGLKLILYIPEFISNSPVYVTAYDMLGQTLVPRYIPSIYSTGIQDVYVPLPPSFKGVALILVESGKVIYKIPVFVE